MRERDAGSALSKHVHSGSIAMLLPPQAQRSSFKYQNKHALPSSSQQRTHASMQCMRCTRYKWLAPACTAPTAASAAPQLSAAAARAGRRAPLQRSTRTHAGGRQHPVSAPLAVGCTACPWRRAPCLAYTRHPPTPAWASEPQGHFFAPLLPSQGQASAPNT